MSQEVLFSHKAKKLFLLAGLALRDTMGFSLGNRALSQVQRQQQRAAVDESLSALLAADVRAAQADSSVWTPKAVPLLESTARHVIIDDAFTQQEEVCDIRRQLQLTFGPMF